MTITQELSINCPETLEKITEFIKKQVQKAGLDGAIVSVSGGIDSAVALHCAVLALGPENVTAITMPERDVTQNSDITDVMQHCSELQLTCNTVDITQILHVIRDTLPNYRPQKRVEFGNVKSRLRMIVAYYYSNIEHKMVIGTSNKTELLVGFFTKHGDGGVDLMPLGDLYKTQLRQLAEYLVIPENIRSKPPSPGFYPGHTDEDELGIDYATLDLILYLREKGLTPVEVAKELDVGFDLVERMFRRVDTNEHKRRLPLILRLS